MMCLATVHAQKASNEKTTVFKTDIHCEGCASRIMNNVPSLGKGVKDVKVDVATKEVTVTYDGRKNNDENIVKGLKSIQVQAEPVNNDAKQCCKKEAEGCGKNEGKDCCKQVPEIKQNMKARKVQDVKQEKKACKMEDLKQEQKACCKEEAATTCEKAEAQPGKGGKVEAKKGNCCGN